MSFNQPEKQKANAAFQAFVFCSGFTLLLMLFSFTSSFLPASFQRFWYGLLGVLAAFIVTWVFLRYVRKAGWASIGFRPCSRTPLRFFTGIITGIIVMGITSLAVIYFSGLKVVSNPGSNVLHFLISTVALVPLAYMEEIAFRGYPLQLLKEKAGIRPAVYITSLLFALYHLFNGYNLQDALLGTGTFGILFATGALYANGISFATGMHYAVNLVTSAFALQSDSPAIWLMKTKDGSAAEPHQSGWEAVLIPQLALFIVAVILLEGLIRKKKIS